MAASLSYVIWFLRGSAMMATMVTQDPAWKMIDPLVILDSVSASTPSSGEEQDTIKLVFREGSESVTPRPMASPESGVAAVD